MATRDGTTAKVLLGELLKLARQQSSYKTQEALARAVGVERTGITRAEGGEHPPTHQVLGDILTHTGVTGLAEVAVRGVWRLARRQADPAGAQAASWYEVESRAHTLRFWSPLLVPGIVQAPEYAYEIYRAGGRSHERAMQDADARMHRQALLDQEEAPTLVIALWESTLYHQVGSAQVMRGQLAKLLEVSERPGVLVHVVPSEFGANAGLGGTLALASISGEPDVLLTGSLLEDMVTTDVAQVRAASNTFEQVRGVSANVIESRRIMSEAVEAWESK